MEIPFVSAKGVEIEWHGFGRAPIATLANSKSLAPLKGA